MALIPPFSGSCASLPYGQPAQGAVMFLVVTHPGVTHLACLGPWLLIWVTLACCSRMLSVELAVIILMYYA